AAVEEAGVAGVHPAIRGPHFRSGFLVLVITLEYAGAAKQQLSALQNFYLDLWCRRPHGIGVDLAIRLHRDVDGGFRLPVELLQVDTERTVVLEDFRPDRLARRVANLEPAQSKPIAQ